MGKGPGPEKVFDCFRQICAIPHGSGNVDRLSDYIVEFAGQRGLSCRQDRMKNVIIIKEASRGYEKEPPIILQGHMDMVAVKKPETPIDLRRDPLQLKAEGDELYAEGTSLGGDDGIAVAMALAILDDRELRHPRLEVVLTVDEETGMDGARELDVSLLTARRMLNLDSEKEGIFLTGCAGGARVDWTLPVAFEKREGIRLQVAIKGLIGGHSGDEIHKERGNSNSLMGRLLLKLYREADVSLCALSGGLFDNAIPRETMATLLVSPQKEKACMEALRQVEAELQRELETKDPGVRIEGEREARIKPEGLTETQCLCREDMQRVSSLICAAPIGVQAMSADMEGLVETSLNMGILKLTGEGLTVQFSVRSSLESAKRALILKLSGLAALAGATQRVRGDYPGWAYRKDSPFRDQAVAVYERLYGTKPKLEAIHAGLECGLFVAKLPGLECISIGPDMRGIHTTEERLSISSTERVFRYVLELLSEKQPEQGSDKKG